MSAGIRLQNACTGEVHEKIAEEIAESIEKLLPYVVLYICIDTSEHLHRSEHLRDCIYAGE